MNTSQTQCMRCGTCCEKGGPALHGADLELVLQKQIAPENLFTLRRGELVHDNVNGGLMVTDQEIIKVKSVNGAAACMYYDPEQKACTIYDFRPLECRAMNCRDTEAAEAVYDVDRLDRAAVFGAVDWIMELIQSHEEKCGYAYLDEFCRRRQAGDSKRAGQAILEAVRYDVEMRNVVEEKTALSAQMMDLIFGRCLETTIPAQFGIKLR
ncbi:MAG: YkgJ family cysteine cluster protein [Desulfobacteraceae bacterium]|nr:YkgJ family cysteine cluster protein [Desulfobacteraceae bacterium]